MSATGSEDYTAGGVGGIHADFLTSRRGAAVSSAWTVATQVAGLVCLGLVLRDRHRAQRNGAIVRLTNAVALWSIPTAQAIRALQEDTAAFFYVDQRSGARVLIQLQPGQAGEQLVGAVPGLAEGLPLP